MIKESIATSVANFIIYGANWEWVHYSSFVFCLIFEVSLVLDRNLIFYEGKEIGIKKEGNSLSNSPLRYDGYLYTLSDSIINIPRLLRGFSTYVQLLILVLISLQSLLQVICVLPLKKAIVQVDRQKRSSYIWKSMLFFYSEIWFLLSAQQFLDTLSCKDYNIWLADYRSALASTVLEAWRRPVGLEGAYEFTVGLQVSPFIRCYSVGHGYLATVGVANFCFALITKCFEHFYSCWLPRHSCFLSKMGSSDVAHQVIIFTIMCIRVFMISIDSTSVTYKTLYSGMCSALLFLDLVICLVRPPFLSKKRNQLRMLEIFILITAAALPFIFTDFMYDISRIQGGPNASQPDQSSYPRIKDFVYKSTALGILNALIYKLASRILDRKQGTGSRNKTSTRMIQGAKAKNPSTRITGHISGSRVDFQHSDSRRLQTLLLPKLDTETVVRFVAKLLDYALLVLHSNQLCLLNFELASTIQDFKITWHDYLLDKENLSTSLTSLHQNLVNFELESDCQKIPKVGGLIHVPKFADQLSGLNLPKGYPLKAVLDLVNEIFLHAIQDHSSARGGLRKVPPMLARYFIYFNCEFLGKISNSIYRLQCLKFSHLDENQRLTMASSAQTKKQHEVSQTVLRLSAEPSDDIAHINLDYLILKDLVMSAGQNNLETGNSLYFHKPDVVEGFKVFIPVYRLDECVFNINTTCNLAMMLKAVLTTRKDLMETAAHSRFKSTAIASAAKSVGTRLKEIKQLFVELARSSPITMTSTRLLNVFFQMHLELDLRQAGKLLADLKRSVYHHETELVREVDSSKRVFEFGFDTSKRNYQKIVAYLSAEPETFHQIIYATANIEKALGFTAQEVLGADLEAILPRPIKGFHKELCHPRTANSVFFAPGTEFNFFVKNIQQDILPCLAWVRISPNLDNGLALVGLLSVQVNSDQTDEAVRRVILSPNYTILEMCQAAKFWFDYDTDITLHCQLLSQAFEIYERVVDFRYQKNFERIEDLFGTQFSLSDYEDYCALSEGVVFQICPKDSTGRQVCVRIKHVKTRKTEQLVLVPEFIECSSLSRYKSAQELHFVQRMLHTIHFGSFDTQLHGWKEGFANRPEKCVKSLVRLMKQASSLQGDENKRTFFENLNMVPELATGFVEKIMKVSPPGYQRLFLEEKPANRLVWLLEQKCKTSAKFNLISSIMRQVNAQFDEALDLAILQQLECDCRLHAVTFGREPIARNQLQNEDWNSLSHKVATGSTDTLPTSSKVCRRESATPKSKDSEILQPKHLDRIHMARQAAINFPTPHTSCSPSQLKDLTGQMSFHNDSPKEHYVIDQLSDKTSKPKKPVIKVPKMLATTTATEARNYLSELPKTEVVNTQPDVRFKGNSSDEPIPHHVQPECVDQRLIRSSGKMESSHIQEYDSNFYVAAQQSIQVAYWPHGACVDSDISQDQSEEGRMAEKTNNPDHVVRTRVTDHQPNIDKPTELEIAFVRPADRSTELPLSAFLPVAAPPSSPDDLRMRVTFGSVKEEASVLKQGISGELIGRVQNRLLTTKSGEGSPQRLSATLRTGGLTHSDCDDLSQTYQTAVVKPKSGYKSGSEADILHRKARILSKLVERRKQWAFSLIVGKVVSFDQLVQADKIKDFSHQSDRVEAKIKTKSSIVSGQRYTNQISGLSKRPEGEQEQGSSEKFTTEPQLLHIEQVLGSEEPEHTTTELFRAGDTYEKNYSTFANLPLRTFPLCRYLCIVVLITNISFAVLFALGLFKTTVQQSNYLFLKENAVLMDEFTWAHYEIVTKSLLMELTMAVKSGSLPEDLFKDYFQTNLLDDVLIYEVLLPEFIYARTSVTSQFKLKDAVRNSSLAAGDNLDDFKPWQSDKLVYQPSDYRQLSPSPVKFTQASAKLGTVTELVMNWVDYLHYYEKTMLEFAFGDYAQVDSECLWLHLVRLNGIDRATEENLKFVDLGIRFLRYKIQRVVNAFTYLVIPEEALGLFVLAAIAALFVRVYKSFTVRLETLFRFSRAALEAEQRQLAQWVKLVDLMIARDDVLYANLPKVFPATALTAYHLQERTSGEVGAWTSGTTKSGHPQSLLLTASQPNTPYTAKSGKSGDKGPKKQIVSGWNDLATLEQDKIALKAKTHKQSAESLRRQKAKMNKYSSVVFNSRCFGLMGTLAVPLVIYVVFGVILLIPNLQNIDHAKSIQNRFEVSLTIVEIYNRILLSPAALWYAVVHNDTYRIGAQKPSEFFIKSKGELLDLSDKLARYQDKDLGNMTETFRYFMTDFKMCDDCQLGEREFFYMLKFRNCTSTPAALYNTNFLAYFKLTASMMDEISRSYLDDTSQRGIEVFKDAMKDTTFSLFFTATTFLFLDLGFYSLTPDLTSSIKESISAKTPSSGELSDSQTAYVETYIVLYLLAAFGVTWSLAIRVQKILQEFLVIYKLISFRLMHHNKGLINMVHRHVKKIEQKLD